MKKRMVFVTILMLTLLFQTKAQNMIITMNGHPHSCDDYISDTLQTIYTNEQKIITHFFDSALVANGTGQPSLKFPVNITSINLSLNNSGTGTFSMQLDGCEIKFLYNSCSNLVDYSLLLSGQLQLITDSLQYKLKIYNVIDSAIISTSSKPRFWYQFWNYIACDVYKAAINSMAIYAFANDFNNMITNLEIPIMKISDVPRNASPSLIQEVMNSFPLSIKISKNGSGPLNLSMDFMQGTSPTDTSFNVITPPPTTNTTFNYLGFACPYYSFQNAFNGWSTMPLTNMLDKETLLLNTMSNNSVQSIRISIPWRDLSPCFNTSVSTYSGLTGAALDRAVNTLLARNDLWANSDSIINRAMRLGLDVVPQITQQESDVATFNGMTVVPDASPQGTILKASNNNYYMVSANTYLYNLKVFAHAVVRRYRNKIGLWAIEAELNAAKFAQMIDSSRHGSLWQDDSKGGFQDSLWKVLVNAVRQEDPTAKLTSPLHMLNMMPGLQRFAPDMDIVGVNMYPNDYFADPVMGFAVGEMVWATRRALIGLGMTNKEVHVTETNYAGIYTISIPKKNPAPSNWLNYTYARQSDYLTDAIQSSLQYGATGFFWWGFLDKDTTVGPSLDDYANYGSLIIRNVYPLQLKPAARTYQGLESSTYPGKLSITLANQSLANSADLGGFLALTSEQDSLSSGSSIFASKSRTHISQTYQRSMQGMRHINWTRNSSQFYLKQNIIPSPSLASMNQIAMFTPTNPVSYNLSSIDGIPSVSGTINYWDPWYVDGNGNQPNAFRSIPLSPSFNDSVFLGQLYDPANPSNAHYSVSAPSTLTLNGFNCYFIDWTGSGSAGFPDSTKNTTAVVFTGNNAKVTAEYKGTHISGNPSAFSNNSQRKIVRTGNGWLHMVYESGGHVWYEMSTDNGSTWSLMSPVNTWIGGVEQLGTPGPLDSAGIGGKCPSIDYSHNPIDSTSIVIVFEQKYGTSYSIRQMPYLFCKSDTCPCNNGPWIMDQSYSSVVYGTDPYATTNANPTITWGSDGSGLLTWETKSNTPGIYYLIGEINGTLQNQNTFNPGFHSAMTPALISGTTIKSTNATSSGCSWMNNFMYYDIAWEQDSTSTKSFIKHTDLQSVNNGNNIFSVTQDTIDQISSNSISKNYKPSIVTLPDYSYCSWIGDLDGSGTWMNVYAYERKVGYSTIYRYGVGAQSVSMNKDNGINYYLAWSQNSSYSQNPSSCTNSVVGSNLSAENLNTTGQNIQLCNGPTSSKMYVSSFYNSALPYSFQTSNSLTSAPHGDILSQTNAVSKSNAVSATNTVTSGRGRGIAIDKGNTGFYYSIGDINVDGNLIDFVSTNNKTKYNNMDTLNNVLLSQPFVIKSNSVLSFTENSGAADTVAATGILGANGYISFTVQVIDNASGSVLGTIKKVKFSSSNLQLKYKTSPYTLSTTGLGGKTGRLKIIVETNLDSLRLALVEQYAGPGVGVMGQASTLEMQPTSAAGVSLGSYPNPFNPNTNISYQLIENSRISIKVYDILGRQVTTLVDGNKTAGQYIAVFDGSHYASGVYFVRMMVQGASTQQIVKTLKIQMLK